MPATFYSAGSRGGGDYGWLRTRYSYSFANYYDPDRMGFGALRVVNDDWIAPGKGFSTHSHQNMEIITIPLRGALAHKDDTGGEGKVKEGMVQVMSAGTGVLHSEFNASTTEPVALFQIWIEPKAYGVMPRYQEASYNIENTKTANLLLVGPEKESRVWIHQNAYISRLTILAGEQFTYPLYNPKHGVYLLVIAGTGEALSYQLSPRDALEITEEKQIEIVAKTQMDILCVEVPISGIS